MRLGDDAGSQRLGGLPVRIVIEHRSETLSHVPLDIIGEHAQADMCAHARGSPMEDRSNLQVDGLDAADGAFNLSEAFVGSHTGAVIESFDREAGADHIDAIETRLVIDLIELACKGEIAIGDGEREVLGWMPLNTSNRCYRMVKCRVA